MKTRAITQAAFVRSESEVNFMSSLYSERLPFVYASPLPSCPGVSVSALQAVFAGHCVNLCSLGANEVQLGSVGAAGAPLQTARLKPGFLGLA